MHIFGGEPPRPYQEFEPFRPLTLRADLAAAEKVSFRHNADELACRIDDWQPADPVLQHQLHGFEDRFIGKPEITFRVMTSLTCMVMVHSSSQLAVNRSYGSAPNDFAK